MSVQHRANAASCEGGVVTKRFLKNTKSCQPYKFQHDAVSTRRRANTTPSQNNTVSTQSLVNTTSHQYDIVSIRSRVNMTTCQVDAVLRRRRAVPKTASCQNNVMSRRRHVKMVPCQKNGVVSKRCSAKNTHRDCSESFQYDVISIRCRANNGFVPARHCAKTGSCNKTSSSHQNSAWSTWCRVKATL